MEGELVAFCDCVGELDVGVVQVLSFCLFAEDDEDDESEL